MRLTAWDRPEPEPILANPEFMVLHALNLVDPENWHEVDM